jgi:hypothetical protein
LEEVRSLEAAPAGQQQVVHIREVENCPDVEPAVALYEEDCEPK